MLNLYIFILLNQLIHRLICAQCSTQFFKAAFSFFLLFLASATMRQALAYRYRHEEAAFAALVDLIVIKRK